MKYFVILGLILVSVIAQTGVIYVDAYHGEQNSRGSSDPMITASENDVYAVWLESTNSEFGDVYFAKITGGKTVEDPINITKGTSFYPQPQIHSSKNNVYLLWEDRETSDGDDKIFFAKSNDYGKSFSAPKILPSNNESIFRPASVHQVNDVVYVFASNWNRATQQNNIVYMTSNDFGDTFSELIILFNHEQSDQEIRIQVYDDTIYILSDDRNDFNEIGSLYLRKILPDGTLTEIVNVNDGKTTVTHPQFAVFEENVYVSWRDRVDEKGNFGITERWYQVFTKSHDGGNTFDDVITFESDPESIDSVGSEGDFVFAHGNSVYVLWKSEYYDGKTQSFKIFLAYSDNRGKDFTIDQVPLNEQLPQHGAILSNLDNNNFYQMGITTKNPPFNDAAIYFSSMNLDSRTTPVDILKNISTQIGSMPDFASNENNIYFVTQGNHNQNCILYSFSNDGGKSFSDVVNISPNGTPKMCLGVEEEITSPKHQKDLGVNMEDIRCNADRSRGYILVLRDDSNHPMCVTSVSFEKMTERKIIDEQSFETIALGAAKNFLLSHPKIFDVVDDSLNLEIFMTRHSIPPAFVIQGSFETTSPIYDNDADPFNHSVEMTLVQNNKVHLALIDESYSLFDTDLPEKRNPRENTIVSPTLKTILSPGDRINNKGLIPLMITEVSQGGYAETTHWTFQSIGYQGDNRDEKWGILPDQYRTGETVDQDGTDAIDRERMPENFGIPMPLFIFPILCGAERIEGESGWHYTLPTRSDTSMVHFRSTDKGIYPDSTGTYDIEFVSLFKTEVELQPNSKIISNQTILCPLENTSNDATHAYYTKLKFQIDDSWTASYYMQPSFMEEVHEHATILAKIFGDKFDFTHSDFQLKDPKINFEPAESDMIHRTTKDATIGFLFETLGMHLNSQCFVFYDKREFCTNDEYELKFYVNDQRKDDISNYVLSEDDRILISYGAEKETEVQQQLSELESLARYNYFSLDNLMNMDVGTVSEGTYNADLGFETTKKLMEFEMTRNEEKNIIENELFQNQKMFEELAEQGEGPAVLKSISDVIGKLENKLAELTKNKSQYTTEEILQKVEEIESENILMYKLRPEKYQEYVEAKISLENTIHEKYWNGKTNEEKMQSFPLVSVLINPNSKNLEIMLDDIVKNRIETTKQYESVIEDLMPEEIPWIVIFSND